MNEIAPKNTALGRGVAHLLHLPPREKTLDFWVLFQAFSVLVFVNDVVRIMLLSIPQCILLADTHCLHEGNNTRGYLTTAANSCHWA